MKATGKLGGSNVWLLKHSKTTNDAKNLIFRSEGCHSILFERNNHEKNH